jgi:hypothetical protein
MEQLSRKRLKVSKTIDNAEHNRNSVQDVVAVKLAFAIGENKRFKVDKELARLEIKDAELERVTKIPEEASDLIVVTKTKKLCAYIVAITAKSPSKFRGTFVNRMQNKTMDALENLITANFIKLDSMAHINEREALQRQAVINLKICGYVALLAEEAGCIIAKQYKQISIMIGECINLAVAWMKSDAKRWKEKQT